jgi:DNA ligase-associated metallophosphoesterase
MTSELQSCEVAGEQVHLLPEAALYWPRKSTLAIADPHFGKAAAFRARGVPVPEATTGDNLARLDSALARTGARRLVVLGDFLHARHGRSASLMARLDDWRAHNAGLAILLVRGNHDDRAGDPPEEWRIECRDEPVVCSPFVWRHEPASSNEGYVLAGHVHPAVHLSGAGGLSATLRCFYFGKHYGLLPAFGDFTGAALVRPRSGDQVFVLVDGRVLRKA